MPVYTWSKTAADNATADSTINWAEGQAPSSVNDSARAEMAAVAKWRDDISGTLMTTGSSTAYSVFTNSGFTSAEAMSGALLCVIPHTPSGASPTLSVDGLTARPIRAATGVNVPAGALVQGTPYLVTYLHATTEFVLVGQVGTPATLQALSTDPGATASPTLDLYRNSASPAANDLIGAVEFTGKDSAGNKTLYARIASKIVSPTAGETAAAVLMQHGVDGVLTTLIETGSDGIDVHGNLSVAGDVAIGGVLATDGGVNVGGDVTVAGRIMPSTPAFTQQVLTSGTNLTYATPNNCRAIQVRMVGGGGCGGNAGNAGGDTSFNSVVAKGGGGSSGSTAGIGGTGGAGSANFRCAGGDGENAFNNRSVGATGGSSSFGGGARGRGIDNSTAARAAGANTGAGGGGGTDCGGGGAGEYVEFYITSPSPTYTYAVGAGGSAGSGGGGAGGSGIIIVDEYY